VFFGAVAIYSFKASLFDGERKLPSKTLAFAMNRDLAHFLDQSLANFSSEFNKQRICQPLNI